MLGDRCRIKVEIIVRRDVVTTILAGKNKQWMVLLTCVVNFTLLLDAAVLKSDSIQMESNKRTFFLRVSR